MHAKLAALLAAGLGAVVLVASAGCGSLHTTSASDTPTGPQATATALFVNINRKRALVNEPTYRPGTDTDHPFAQAHASEPADTPDPSPTPVEPRCGATIAGWPAIVAKYGGFYKGNVCGAFTTATGTQLAIGTAGVNGGPGAIATYMCEPADTSVCAATRPQHPGRRGLCIRRRCPPL